MAKLAVLAALLVALLAIAVASTSSTTITIEEENSGSILVEEDNTGGVRSRCQREMQMQKMRHCMMYMSGGSSYETLGNPTQQYFRQCCQELENMDSQCRCPAIKKVVMRQQQGGEWQGEEMQEMMQMAKYLPSKCGMGPQMCQF